MSSHFLEVCVHHLNPQASLPKVLGIPRSFTRVVAAHMRVFITCSVPQVIVQARKPDFFNNNMSLYEVVTDDGLMRPAMTARKVVISSPPPPGPHHRYPWCACYEGLIVTTTNYGVPPIFSAAYLVSPSKRQSRGATKRREVTTTPGCLNFTPQVGLWVAALKSPSI